MLALGLPPEQPSDDGAEELLGAEPSRARGTFRLDGGRADCEAATGRCRPALTTRIGRFCEASGRPVALSDYIEVVKRFDDVFNIGRFVSRDDQKQRWVHADSLILGVRDRQLFSAVGSAALTEDFDLAIAGLAH
jgi:hypothetical protein